MATNFVAKLPTPCINALTFRYRMEYRCVNVHISSVNNGSISCENFAKFGPVTPEADKAHLSMSGTTRPKNWRI